MQMESFQVIGIKTRTTNADEFAGNGKIAALWSQFYSENIMANIPGKVDYNVLAIYHDYESDANGPYSLMIGMKVAPGTTAPQGMEVLQIPTQKYEKMTSAKGPMPGVVVDLWQRVWSSSMNRKYSQDIEVYGEKAMDPQTAEVDLYISTL